MGRSGKFKILYRAADVRKEVYRIFSRTNQRRVAISAFVGQGAEAYLPSPKGLQVICWPKAGGTSPSCIRSLIKRGAKVQFADRLHMKIYWSQKEGAIITSANLSTNALGSGNLREIGILVPSATIDIDRLISSVNQRPVTKEELLTLERQERIFRATSPTYVPKSPVKTFLEWYSSKPWEEQWSLGWAESPGKVSKAACETTRREFNLKEPCDWISARKTDFQEGDWILSFFIDGQNSSRIDWLYVHRVVRILRSDRAAYDNTYSYQAIQVYKLGHYGHAPFQINKGFREAFRKAVRTYGTSKIKRLRSTKVPAELLQLTLRNYRQIESS